MCRKLIYLLLLVVVLSVTCNIANADLVDGLLVWHGFNNLMDGSGKGHDAVLGGNAFISDGLLWLDGDGDYADVGTPVGFGPVNPLVDALSDFTIAIAYACDSTGTFSTGLGSVLVSIGPDVASGTSDFALTTHNDGQAIWFWDVSGVPSRQSEVGYTDGTVHLVIITYKEATDLFTFYHLDGTGGVVAHGDSTVTAWTPDWSAEWDETLNYGIRLGLSRNRTLAGSVDVENTVNLEGQIDMFAIWNRILDLSEMPQIPSFSPAIELASSLNPSD
ncbi:MAG: hypothetical protein ACYS6K_09605, partial [Planctomycetota bacterium]